MVSTFKMGYKFRKLDQIKITKVSFYNLKALFIINQQLIITDALPLDMSKTPISKLCQNKMTVFIKCVEYLKGNIFKYILKTENRNLPGLRFGEVHFYCFIFTPTMVHSYYLNLLIFLIYFFYIYILHTSYVTMLFQCKGHLAKSRHVKNVHVVIFNSSSF